MLEFFCFLRAELIKIIETHYLFSVKFVEIVPTVRRKSLKEFKEFLWEKTNINIESLKESPNFKKFVDNIRRQSLLNNTSVFEQLKVEEEELDSYIQEKIEYYTSKYWKSFFGCDCDCCRENLLSLSEISLEEPSDIFRTPSGTVMSDTSPGASVEDTRIASQEMSHEQNNQSDGENNDDDDDESDDGSAFDFEDYHFDLYDKIFEIMLKKKDVIKYARSEKYIEDLMWIVNTVLKYPYYGGYIRDDLDQNNCFALENDFIIQFFYDQKPLLYMILSVFHPRKKKIFETLNQFYDIIKIHTEKYIETQETNTWRDFVELVMNRQNNAQDQTQDQIHNQIQEQISNQIQDQIHNQIQEQISNQIQDQIQKQIQEQIQNI